MNLTKDLIGRTFTGDATGYDFKNCPDKVFLSTEPCEAGGLYIDVYVNGGLAYMVGESCELVDFTNDSVTLKNENEYEGQEVFTISKSHFDNCFTLNPA